MGNSKWGKQFYEIELEKEEKDERTGANREKGEEKSASKKV